MKTFPGKSPNIGKPIETESTAVPRHEDALADKRHILDCRKLKARAPTRFDDRDDPKFINRDGKGRGY